MSKSKSIKLPEETLEKAAEEYMQGKITISEAAHEAGLTIWEMEKYLVSHGFKSSYSVKDFERELKTIGFK